MNSSKSGVISFRLPANLLEQVERFAKGDGCKSSSAWCQKQIINLLSADPAAVNNSVHFENNVAIEAAIAAQQRQQQQIDHIRKFQMRFFGELFIGTNKEKAFYKTADEGEDEWEKITAAVSPARATDKFAEFSSFVEEISSNSEKMIGPFSGEELIIQRVVEENSQAVPKDDTRPSGGVSSPANRCSAAATNLTEINHVQNSPVQ